MASTGANLPRAWRVARAALSFTVEQVAQGLTGLKALDALIVMAVNQANIAPLTRDTDARYAYGGLSAPAPDESRRPVSIHAIAMSMQLPFETVRRRVHQLEEIGACRHDARGVIVPGAYLSSPAYLQDVVQAHGRMRRLYLDLADQGLLDPLPASNYLPTDEAPVRAAARLLSDFLLRIADTLMRRTHDPVSGLILGAVIVASLSGQDDAGVSASEAARRLGLAGETVRRRLAQLHADGHCHRRPHARYATPLAPDDPAWEPFIGEIAATVQRLMAGLAERGVVESWTNPASAEAQRGIAS
ncbi:MAG: winged helix-turn-helix domain-containing protein [Pseudomonadota bacterium]